MEITYTKIDDNTVKMTTVTSVDTIITVDGLQTQIDRLTSENANAQNWIETRNAQIIDLQAQIQKIKDL